MPYSATTFDTKIQDWVRIHPEIKTVFDVGAGAGKYADLLHNVNGEITLDAIEADKEYIDQFRLITKYRAVKSQPIEVWLKQVFMLGVEFQYDLIILGDVLEHLFKSDGIDVINYLIYHCKYMICVIPHNMPQGVWEGHQLEQHISLWSSSDFLNFEKIDSDYVPPIELLILKGLL